MDCLKHNAVTCWINKYYDKMKNKSSYKQKDIYYNETEQTRGFPSGQASKFFVLSFNFLRVLYKEKEDCLHYGDKNKLWVQHFQDSYGKSIDAASKSEPRKVWKKKAGKYGMIWIDKKSLKLCDLLEILDEKLRKEVVEKFNLIDKRYKNCLKNV